MHRVIYNQGDQKVRFVPVDREGRPSRPTTVTYTMVDLRLDDASADRTIASGAASYAGGDTTISASAGPSQTDPKLMTVADATGLAAGRVAIIEQVERREVFAVAGISGTTSVYAVRGLQHDYTSGATVKGAEVEATFPTAEAAEETNVQDGEGPYQVTWVYTLASDTYVVPEAIWLSRYSVAPIIGTIDILRAYPRMTQKMPGLIDAAIAAATEDVVADLSASGLNVPYYRASVVGRVAARQKALAYLFTWSGTDQDVEMADRHLQAYERMLAQLTTGNDPRGTARVVEDTDVAPAGSSNAYNDNLLLRP